MSEGGRMDARITELEIKICYAEDLVDELNRPVYRQQRQIDRLLAEVAALREQLRSAVPAEQPGPRDELPPHW